MSFFFLFFHLREFSTSVGFLFVFSFLFCFFHASSPLSFIYPSSLLFAPFFRVPSSSSVAYSYHLPPVYLILFSSSFHASRSLSAGSFPLLSFLLSFPFLLLLGFFCPFLFLLLFSSCLSFQFFPPSFHTTSRSFTISCPSSVLIFPFCLSFRSLPPSLVPGKLVLFLCSFLLSWRSFMVSAVWLLLFH